jgi:lysozyme
MKASQKLIDQIKKSEALRLTAYQDAKGVWTIGYGHTAGVKRGDRCTQFQAEQWLKEDLADFERYVNTRVRNIRTQGQFDAVVDFCYNVGYGVKGFGGSTLKQYIETGRKCYEIQQQFLRWVNSGGKFLGGLYSRRIWEAACWAD